MTQTSCQACGCLLRAEQEGGFRQCQKGRGACGAEKEGGRGEEACLWRGPCSNILRDLVRITMSIEPSSLQYDTEEQNEARG